MPRADRRVRRAGNASGERGDTSDRIAAGDGRGRLGGRRAVLFVAALHALHALGLVLLLDRPGALLDDRPIVEQDWGLHTHHLRSAAGFWAESGRLWGYNPLFMAGYPSNTFQDLSIKLFELAALATPFLGPVAAFKGWVFLVTAAVPWLGFFAYRNLFGSRGGGALAAFLATVYWWASLPREMFFYGMVGFPLGGWVALLAFSLLWRLRDAGARPTAAHAGWIAACVVLLPLHLQAVWVVLVPGAALLVLRPSRALWTWAAAGAGVAVAVNLFWLVPLLDRWGDNAAAELVALLPIFTSADPLTVVRDYLTTASVWSFRATAAEKLLRGALLVLGVLGLVRLFRDRRPSPAVPLALLCAALFALAYFGSLVPALRGWQPLRFTVPLNAALALLAVFAVVAARRDAGLRRALPAAVLGLGLAGAAASIVGTEAAGAMRLRTELPENARRIVDHLDAHAPRDARVLFEESGDETGFVYGGVYLSSFVAHATGLELVGGPINLYADRHHVAELHSGRLLRRDVARFDERELREVLRRYNVGTIVAFHPETLAALRRLGGLVEPAARFGEVLVLDVHQPRSFFLRGNGRVVAGFDRIDCFDVEGEDVVLKYHWVRGLRASPPLVLEPVSRPGDPIPLIRIREPPARFRLSLGASRPEPPAG